MNTYAGNGFPLFPNGLVEVKMVRGSECLTMKVYSDRVEEFVTKRQNAGWVLVEMLQ